MQGWIPGKCVNMQSRWRNVDVISSVGNSSRFYGLPKDFDSGVSALAAVVAEVLWLELLLLIERFVLDS